MLHLCVVYELTDLESAKACKARANAKDVHQRKG